MAVVGHCALQIKANGSDMYVKGCILKINNGKEIYLYMLSMFLYYLYAVYMNQSSINTQK